MPRVVLETNTSVSVVYLWKVPERGELVDYKGKVYAVESVKHFAFDLGEKPSENFAVANIQCKECEPGIA